MLSSIHTHTIFCDGKDDVAAMCRAAFEKGLCAIGFSAHAPVEKAALATNWHIKKEDMADYAAEVRAAKDIWKGKLAVFLGLELDYIRGKRCAYDEDIKALAPDYLISSVHYLQGKTGGLFTIDGPAQEAREGLESCFGGNSGELAASYWDTVTEMVTIGGFDIVGHLDLVKKHAQIKPDGSQLLKIDTESSAYLAGAREAAYAISRAGLAVEVNTGGMNRGYFNEPCPSLSILRILREFGVPILLSADAHNAGDLDGHYAQALSFMARAGYTSHLVPQPVAGEMVFNECAL